MRNIIGWLFLCFCIACTGGHDPTFMRVCEDGNGVFTYPAGDHVAATGCSQPKAIEWPGLPLTVSIEVDLAEYDESLDGAIVFWESEVGLHLFVRSSAVDADVRIVSGSASSPGLAATRHGRRNGKLWALIEIRKPGDIGEMQWVLAHELGHALGLAHDPQHYSIMHSEIEDVGLLESDDPDAPDFPTYFVTDNDAEALQALYGR